MEFVTFDLFSALIDSRTGASAALAGIAGGPDRHVDGAGLYDAWDARNKASQRDLTRWVPFAEHCRRALAGAYTERGLPGDPDTDVVRLLDSVADWPLWPGVAGGLPVIAALHRVGILSNVDDDIFARTAMAPLVEPDAVLTSQRLAAYKPSPLIYTRARDAGVTVHVASSARDVRGALEAGITVVRLRRRGHDLDPDGPTPTHEVGDLTELAAVLDRLG